MMKYLAVFAGVYAVVVVFLLVHYLPIIHLSILTIVQNFQKFM